MCALVVGLTGVLFVGEAAAQACVEPPAGLVSWWTGDGDADDIADSNPGTLLNGATFAAGKVGQAFALDGDDDTVEIAHNANLKPAAQVTIGAWIKLTSSAIDTELAEIFRKEDGDERILLSFQPDGFCFNGGLADFSFIGTSGTPPCLAFGLSTASGPLASGGYREFEVDGVFPTLDDGEFHHVAATYDGTERRIYTDGISMGVVADSGAIGTAGTAPAYIGSLGGGSEFFGGLIDEVELFDRALTYAEVQDIFNAGSAGKCKATFRLRSLAQDIKDLGLKAGISRSLEAKVETALNKFTDGNPKNDNAAIGSLNAFTHHVGAQSGKHIPAADAEKLAFKAQQAIEAESSQN